ncbi:MAG: DUF4139 domain-containing protein [Bacteroidetes bacterium]|nr:DUF4139 domain-containing protein [Bacteroidota bacterium]
MKKTLLLTIAIFSFLFANSQITSKTINTKVKQVTVYMNGAQITHTADVALTKGSYNLIFNGIAPTINQKSVQVTANNDVKITSVTYFVDYMESKSESARINSLKDSLKLLTKNMKSINNQIAAFGNEKDLVLKNWDLKGTTTGVQVLELQKATDFYRTKINEINNQTQKLSELNDSYSDLYNRIQKQLYELNSKQNQPIYKLSVTADVANNTTTPIVIKYLVSNTGWAAYYDIRAIDVNSPIQLDYKARVFNNCGLDWENVKLTLSTADPSQSAQRPTLTPWGLNYNSDYTEYNEGYLNDKSVMRDEDESNMADSIVFSSEREKGKKQKQWTNKFTTIEVSELSVDFEIKTPYSVPSDNKVYFVDVQTQELPAKYKYIAIPKIDKDAFLVASVTGWENLNLIEGQANIFYGGTYIGQSYIDTRFATDSLEISLGRDKKVAVTRVKKQDLSSKSFIGTNKKEMFIYEINVRNNNSSPIDIEIQDQIPIAQQSDIKIEAIETSKATPDPLSGKLVYSLKLAPSESKVITISFSVQYPKSKKVNVSRSKKVSCPKF